MENLERFQKILNFDKDVDRVPMVEWAGWWDKTCLLYTSLLYANYDIQRLSLLLGFISSNYYFRTLPEITIRCTSLVPS